MKERVSQRCRRFAGYTFLELLIVIAILALLMGLILAAVQKVRASVAQNACQNQMRQLALALHHYHETHRQLPAGTKSLTAPMRNSSWQLAIMPNLEQESLYRQAEEDFRRSSNWWNLKDPHPGLLRVMPQLLCPSESRHSGKPATRDYIVAFTHYFGTSGISSAHGDGMLFLESKVRFREVTDGLSHTLLLGERPADPQSWFGWWYAGAGQDSMTQNGAADHHLGVREVRRTYRTPTCRIGPYRFQPVSTSDPCGIFHYWSLHPGGANFAFVDGSVRFFSYAADSILEELASRAGGETVDIP